MFGGDGLDSMVTVVGSVTGRGVVLALGPR